MGAATNNVAAVARKVGVKSTQLRLMPNEPPLRSLFATVTHRQIGRPLNIANAEQRNRHPAKVTDPLAWDAWPTGPEKITRQILWSRRRIALL